MGAITVDLAVLPKFPQTLRADGFEFLFGASRQHSVKYQSGFDFSTTPQTKGNLVPMLLATPDPLGLFWVDLKRAL
jgi:hypothetical protein